MKSVLIFYIGFTMGMCFMDYLDVQGYTRFHLYRKSIFKLLLSLLFAPLTFLYFLCKSSK